MNRKSRFLLLAFLGLLGVVLAVILWPKSAGGPDLKMAGWGVGQKVEKAEEAGPIDGIEVEIGGRKAALKRSDKGRWSMTPPDGANADRFKVRQVIDAFREDLSSVVSTGLRDADPKAFGLDDATRVRVTLWKGGEPFASLDIGSVQKLEGQAGGEPDTFVRVPGFERAYRLIGKDLRRPFDEGLNGLRDRKVFDFDGADVTGVAIRNPGAADASDREIDLALDEPDAAKKDRAWHVAKPDGVPAGDVKSWVGQVSGLYATAFADALPPDVVIGPQSYSLRLTLAGGRAVTATLSENQAESAYVKVDGVTGFAKVSKYSADQLRKRTGDLRDKTLFGAKREDVVGMEISDGAKRVAFARLSTGGWRASEPDGLAIGRAQVDSLLGDVETLKADAVLPPSQVNGADTGLDRPAVTVTLKTRTGAKTLLVGKEKEKGVFYAKLAGAPEVYTLAQWMLARVRKGPTDLKNRKLFDLDEAKLASIELQHKDETVVLVPSGDVAKGSGWRATAPRDEGALKAETVRALVTTLTGLQVKDFPDKASKAAGLDGAQDLKVTLTTKDGAKHVLRVSAEKKDGDPFGVSPTEKDFRDQVFTLNPYQVKNFQKRLAELL